jgi:hypothetical protein
MNADVGSGGPYLRSFAPSDGERVAVGRVRGTGVFAVRSSTNICAHLRHLRLETPDGVDRRLRGWTQMSLPVALTPSPSPIRWARVDCGTLTSRKGR